MKHSRDDYDFHRAMSDKDYKRLQKRIDEYSKNASEEDMNIVIFGNKKGIEWPKDGMRVQVEDITPKVDSATKWFWAWVFLMILVFSFYVWVALNP